MTTTKDRTLIGTYRHKDRLQMIVNRYNKSTYYLSNGMYERPDLKVRKIRGQDTYAIYVKWYYLPNTYGSRQDGYLDVYSLADLFNCND